MFTSSYTALAVLLFGVCLLGYAIGRLVVGITTAATFEWMTVGRGVGNHLLAMSPNARKDLRVEVDIVIRNPNGKKDSFLVYTDEYGGDALTKLLLENTP